MPRFLQFLCFVAVAVSLSACIKVEDVADSWSKAAIDPALEGRWYDPTDSRSEIVFVKDGDQYKYSSLEDGETRDTGLVKTLTVGTQKFGLMIKPDGEDAPGGTLVPYKITGDKLMTYRIDAQGTDEDVNVAKEDVESATSLKIEKLDEKSLEALAYIFEQSPHKLEALTAMKQGQ